MSTSKDGMHILPTILHIHGKTANKTTHHKFSSSIIVLFAMETNHRTTDAYINT